MRLSLLLGVVCSCAVYHLTFAASADLIVWYDDMYLTRGHENTYFTNTTTQNELVHFLAQPPITISTLHVQTQGPAGTPGHLSSPQGRALVKSFIAATNHSVGLLFGWTAAYGDATGWNSVHEATPAALNFSAMVSDFAQTLTEAGEAAPVAISLDIEPVPPNKGQPQSYQELANLLGAMRAQLDKTTSSLPLFCTSSFQMEAQYVSCGKHGTNITMTNCVASLCDTTMLMDFRTKANGTNGIIAKHKPTLQAANQAGSKAAICLETNQEVDSPSITFYGKGVDYLSKTMDTVHDEYLKDLLAPSLAPDLFVIEDWRGLQNLASGPTPPVPPTPPSPPTPSQMEVHLVNMVDDNLKVEEVRSDGSKGDTLCTLMPKAQCTVTTDFVVVSGTSAGDKFASWWGDSSYKTAHITLDVIQGKNAYLEYKKSDSS